MTYEELLTSALTFGTSKQDRTGTGTRSLFARQLRYDLAEGFPLITTKKVHFKSIVGELLWFLSGSTNAHELKQKYDVTIWDEWADPMGELGPIYGKQWRDWGGIDQIKEVVQSIKTNPDSRRHIVSAWNVSEVRHMALPPCHCLFQFYVANGKLSCQLYQRSADLFLGVPFNIASYALLTHLVAHQCDLEVGEFIWTGGDCHLYDNHIEQAELQVTRAPFAFPTLKINRKPDFIFDYLPEDFDLVDYQHHPAIKAKVAV